MKYPLFSAAFMLACLIIPTFADFNFDVDNLDNNNENDNEFIQLKTFDPFTGRQTRSPIDMDVYIAGEEDLVLKETKVDSIQTKDNGTDLEEIEGAEDNVIEGINGDASDGYCSFDSNGDLNGNAACSENAVVDETNDNEGANDNEVEESNNSSEDEEENVVDVSVEDDTEDDDEGDEIDDIEYNENVESEETHNNNLEEYNDTDYRNSDENDSEYDDDSSDNDDSDENDIESSEYRVGEEESEIEEFINATVMNYTDDGNSTQTTEFLSGSLVVDLAGI